MKIGLLGDGRLVVVSRDLNVCTDARHVAPTLQAALAGWAEAGPQLELIARSLEAGGQPEERFHERAARAPVPWDGVADPRAPLDGEGMEVAPEVVPLVGANGTCMLVLASGEEGAAGRTFAPAAVTPDELAPGAVVRVAVNGAPAEGSLKLAAGDTVRVEMCDAAGRSVFGAIERTVEG